MKAFNASSFLAGLTIGGLVTLLDLFEKLKPYGLDMPKLVKKYPYITVVVIIVIFSSLIAKSIFNDKKNEKAEKQLAADRAEKERKITIEKNNEETRIYEELAKYFNEKYPDDVLCSDQALGTLYSEVFLKNRPASHESKKIMIELNERKLAQLEIDKLGNYWLKKNKKRGQ
ncbi:hypothetical protein [Peribacillus simplex]|uniref:Uncharacterized protein n=1 Tax=Peribacillus simplex TaxID=1478 RepID=A0A9W4KQZ8_9BACI|nr:hypothetical protein [Peribacillus simplex]CAH0185535.1 hypothetical protein SRABI133_01534 [Peribacillus simplex]